MRHVERDAFIAFALVSISCGGTTEYATLVDAGDAGVVGDGENPGDESSSDSSACATSEGIRICSGASDCPALPAPQCIGEGCTASPSGGSAGICWSDLSDDGNRSCATCKDGEACAFRSSGELVCVPFDLCALLWSNGDEDACRYADKSSFTNAPLPVPSGSCPGNLGAPNQDIVCGGDCGNCGNSSLPCVGRSPGRPFGLCPTPVPAMPGVLGTCSVALDASMACPGALSSYSCAVFGSGSDSVASAYGICMPAASCASAASVLPGGLTCFP
jgi:hypothetical protein